MNILYDINLITERKFSTLDELYPHIVLMEVVNMKEVVTTSNGAKWVWNEEDGVYILKNSL